MLNYFGTDLRSPGHYFFECDGESLRSSKMGWNDIPFNPEKMPENKTVGSVSFYGFGTHSVLAICGSCSDRRAGCKSVFWVNQEVSQEALREMILTTPIAKRIVDKMPFEVKW